MKNSFVLVMLMTGFVYAEKLTLDVFPDRDVTVEEVHQLLKCTIQKPDGCAIVTDFTNRGYTSATFKLDMLHHCVVAYFSGHKDASLDFMNYYYYLNCAVYDYCTSTDEDEKTKILEKDLYRVAEKFTPICNEMRKKEKEARDRK